MLRILSVNPTGLGPYGFHETIQIDGQGLVWLRGPNGSGKSWLLNAISYCLWGRIETVPGGSVVASDEVANEKLGLGCCPRVVFQVGESAWRVTASRKWKALKNNPSPYEPDSSLYPFKGTDLYLELQTAAGWVDKRESSIQKTKEALRQVLGVSYERYLVTTYLAQGKGLDFLQGTQADRMAIFTDVLNLGKWTVAADECKANRERAAQHEQQLAVANARIEGELKSIVILSDVEEAAYNQQIQDLEVAASARSVSKQELDSQLTAVAEQVGSVRVGVNPYDVKLHEHGLLIRDADWRRSKLTGDKQSLIQQEQQRNRQAVLAIQARTSVDAAQISGRISVAKVALSKATQAVTDFTSGKLTTCPTCKQPLPVEISEEHLKADLVNAEVELRSLEELLEEAKAKHTAQMQQALAAENEAHVHRLAVLQEELQSAVAASQHEAETLQRQRQALLEQQTAYSASERDQQRALAELQARRSQLSQQVQILEAEISSSTVQVAHLRSILSANKTRLQRRAELEAMLAEESSKLSVARLDVAEWSWLSKHLGDRGFKSWKLDLVCERLNELLAEALADIDHSFRIWIKPYRMGTSEKILNEITIYVQEGTKKAVPVWLYSGGEASIIALVLLVALWRLADEHGQGTNLLLLDEVVGFLDSKNSQVAVRFLESLRSAGKTAITVSHSQVVDSVQFDAVWTASKQNGVTKLSVEV